MAVPNAGTFTQAFTSAFAYISSLILHFILQHRDATRNKIQKLRIAHAWLALSRRLALTIFLNDVTLVEKTGECHAELLEVTLNPIVFFVRLRPTPNSNPKVESESEPVQPSFITLSFHQLFITVSSSSESPPDVNTCRQMLIRAILKGRWKRLDHMVAGLQLGTILAYDPPSSEHEDEDGNGHIDGHADGEESGDEDEDEVGAESCTPSFSRSMEVIDGTSVKVLIQGYTTSYNSHDYMFDDLEGILSIPDFIAQDVDSVEQTFRMRVSRAVVSSTTSTRSIRAVIRSPTSALNIQFINSQILFNYFRIRDAELLHQVGQLVLEEDERRKQNGDEEGLLGGFIGSATWGLLGELFKPREA
ncbi:hypothetical protein SISSUDRAFT_198255 [Sistotremastrum suecicum HHB10207 ss-3]|uniref:Uncharacterized protein n=1 Tax=Sistotremastrum suecicum HHB10207 ss-3 TaxID=1314776 RepID=A0A166AB85_9AGAM|nr:hypothetical protein SISSUDRAFT_198255 [Sistotremastrum suecicum HHB10207 ss-3]